MIGHPKLKTLQELIDSSTQEELIWMNGYLAGLVRFGVSPANQNQQIITTNGKVTIVYGTDTGHSKKLATDFASKTKKTGGQVKLQSLDQYRLSDLTKEENLLVVISTHGDGEPPAAAKKFFDFIHSDPLQLDKLKYAVLALGDSAYPLFCKAGEDVDVKLQSLGATRLIPMQKCDTDYEADANTWFENVLHTLVKSPSSVTSVSTISKKTIGKKILSGTVLTNINLNGRGSAKETHHIEIAAEDVSYQPGDSIGIVPENNSTLIESIVQLTGIDRTKKLTYRKEEYTVLDLLKKKLNVLYLPERVVKQYASIVRQDIPSTRIDLLNLLKIYPVKDANQFEEVIAVLEPITPRLYSIASSLKAHDGEVHLTVARSCFTVNGEVKYGQCSDFLAQLPENSSFDFYVHQNSEFKPPAGENDIIMIGPGTGIAPFRSFIEERDASGASGRSWLFFGDQHFESDFLYQTEIQNYVQTGSLTRVDVAFSRDQKEKIYVQHKMWAKGAEFFDWLDGGSFIYVCGAKEPMSVDVESMLIKIIEQFGKMTNEQAQEYLLHLKEEGRYQKDVY
jgi:sulfite reductase (NADPH) flavoprotein alpha-component